MSVETNKLRSTREILDAIILKLRALEVSAGVPAFDRVEPFDITDYEDAMTRLAMNQDRTALVIWVSEKTDNQKQMVILTARQTQDFTIFISERNLSSPIKALTGDPDTALPGVVGLKDLVKPALVGEILPSDAETGAELIYLQHQSTERGIISSEDKDKFPARQILIMDFQAVGEWMQVGVEFNEGLQ